MQRLPTWAKVSILSCSFLLAAGFVWYKGFGERWVFGANPGTKSETIWMETSKSAGGSRILPPPAAVKPVTAGEQKEIMTGSKSYSGSTMIGPGTLKITPTTTIAPRPPESLPGTSTQPETKPESKPAK